MTANRRFALTITLGLVFTAMAVVAALASGRYGLTLSQILAGLTGSETLSPTAQSVLVNVRIPRIILALAAGAGLSAAGAAFQAIFSNPLATPDTLGVASGSAFGAVLAILLGFDVLGIQLTGFVMGLAAVALVYLVSSVRGSRSILMLILSGLVIAALFSALISLVKYAADPQDVLPAVTFWMMGSLSGANREALLIGVPVIIVGCAVIYALRWKLNALALPEYEARSLGISVWKLRILAVVAGTLVSAAVVSLCGLIGWVGLLIPHFVRLIVGADNRRVVPASLVFGAFFLLACDTAARSMGAMEIPVSILTAIVGAPVFLLLLRRGPALR